LDSEVLYKGNDIALILMTKVEHVVRIVAGCDSVGFDDAYAVFIASDTHRALMEPEALLWTESSEFIADEFFRERFSRSAD
jgi:hypothetical protein